jgi:hypothetical protein
MQCKNIDDRPILEFLSEQGGWCNWFGNEYENSVTHAMPDGVPEKLALAKMKQLIKRGLVSGCCCGCRGDFEITDKGREKLAEQLEFAERHTE